MADVTNLNAFRKAKVKAQSRKKAQDNRAKFGRTKASKAKDTHGQKLQERTLDGKEIPKDTKD